MLPYGDYISMLVHQKASTKASTWLDMMQVDPSCMTESWFHPTMNVFTRVVKVDGTTARLPKSGLVRAMINQYMGVALSTFQVVQIQVLELYSIDTKTIDDHQIPSQPVFPLQLLPKKTHPTSHPPVIESATSESSGSVLSSSSC